MGTASEPFQSQCKIPPLWPMYPDIPRGMLASRPSVSIRLNLPDPLIPIRTFNGRKSSGSADSPNDRRLHTEIRSTGMDIRSIGMGIRSRTLLMGEAESGVSLTSDRQGQHTRTERSGMQGGSWNGCSERWVGSCSGQGTGLASSPMSSDRALLVRWGSFENGDRVHSGGGFAGSVSLRGRAGGFKGLQLDNV